MGIIDQTDLDVDAILSVSRSSRSGEGGLYHRGALDPWAGLGAFIGIIVASTFVIPRFLTPSTMHVNSPARPIAPAMTNLMVMASPSAPIITPPRTAAEVKEAAQKVTAPPRRLHAMKSSPPRVYARAASHLYVPATLRRYKAPSAPKRKVRDVWRTRMARVEPVPRGWASPPPLVSSLANPPVGVRLRDRQRLSVARAERTEALDDIWIIRQK